MKLKLKNFRCYLEKEFDFGTDGLVLLSGPSGTGKCMGIDTPILMYNGTIKKVQNIKIGDFVMGDDSQPRKVLSLATGNDEMYKIIPNQGTPYIVNSKHILTLAGIKPFSKYIKKECKWIVNWVENCRLCSKYFDNEKQANDFLNFLPQNPVFDISVTDFLELPKSYQKYNYTFHTEVNFPEKEILVDPYLLGLLLGSYKDISIINNLECNNLECNNLNEIFEKYKYIPKEYLSNKYQNNFIDNIKNLGLLNYKHIPLIYKTNSKENRLKLLAGLIDSNGYVFQNKIEIKYQNYQLAVDTEYLSLSLGFMATVIKKGNYYNVKIFGDNLNEIPVILETKKCYSKKQNKPSTMQSFTIKHIGKDKYFGFELGGNNHRFLLGDFTVTHNSTIMMAIMFVLYGEGNKLTTFGKTSCEVEMEFEELIITRTKRPNRLVIVNKKINEELEDDAAQGVINEKFGTAFQVTSYVQQNALNSFIMMSPLEKLAFLEKFAFHGIDLSKVKGRCQSIIKKRNEELISTTSQLEMASEHRKTIIKPEKVHFPIKTNNRENSMKNVVIRLKNCKVLIGRCERDIKNLSEELTDTKIYLSQISAKKEIIDSLNEKINQIKIDKQKIFYEGDDKLLQYERSLKIFLSQKEINILNDRYDKDKQRLETMQECERKEMYKQIESIQSKLWKDYSMNDVIKTISEYQQVFKDCEKLERLRLEDSKTDEEKLQQNKRILEDSKKQVSDKKDLLNKLIMQQESYECPSCHSSLRFQDNELHLFQNTFPKYEKTTVEDLKEEITKISNVIKRLENLIPTEEAKIKRCKEIALEIESLEGQYEGEIPTKEEVESTIEYMKEYKRSQTELDKKLKHLEESLTKNIFSSSVELFQSQLINQKEHIKSIQDTLNLENISLEIEEEDLRNKIQKQKNNKEKMIEYEKQNKISEKELKIITESLKEIEENFTNKYKIIQDVNILQLKIDEKTSEMQELKQKLELAEKNYNQIEEYKKYKESMERYKEWDVKVKELEEKEENKRKRYAAAMMLKDKILEAESLAILNVINSINIHAQEYLDIFFPNDPIVVRLLPFKTTKKNTNKPQVNLEIDYKGMEADINMLSGGELARVVLAYTLALAEIFNSPMIMLDESTASLDQDMTSIVMEGIRKNFGNKLTVVIAHQVISGDFDRQISL